MWFSNRLSHPLNFEAVPPSHPSSKVGRKSQCWPVAFMVQSTKKVIFNFFFGGIKSWLPLFLPQRFLRSRFSHHKNRYGKKYWTFRLKLPLHIFPISETHKPRQRLLWFPEAFKKSSLPLPLSHFVRGYRSWIKCELKL